MSIVRFGVRKPVPVNLLMLAILFGGLCLGLSLRREFFQASDHKSICPWKGEASYFDVEVGGSRNPGAAWTYPTPMPAAAEIAGHVAFWRGVEVSE